MAVIEPLIAAVRAGKPVLLPADTVYGLCADPYREAPVRSLRRLKGRDEMQPTALMASDLELLLECIPELRGHSGTIARALLPGPYTLVLPNPARRFRWLAGSRPETIGVRVPVLTGKARIVLDRLGALAATSANRSGEPDPRRLDDVPPEIRSACAAELDGGELAGVPSTVLDLTGSEPRVLRAGAVSAQDALRAAAGALAGGGG